MLLIDNHSGIYSILCKTTGQQYIGSSKNVYKRKDQHLSELKRHIHPNKNLQEAYNLYGKSSFVFIFLEKCSSDLLLVREYFYLNNIPNLFNISVSPSNPDGRFYVIYPPNTNPVIIQNITKYFKDIGEANFNSFASGLAKVIKGEINQHLGWWARYAKEKEIETNCVLDFSKPDFNLHKVNTSGFKGITLSKSRYRVSFRKKGVNFKSTYYSSLDQAIQVYNQAEQLIQDDEFLLQNKGKNISIEKTLRIAHLNS